MEIDGETIWQDVRLEILKTGPVKVLRRLARADRDLDRVFLPFLEEHTGTDVLGALGEPLAPDADAEVAAWNALLRLAGGIADAAGTTDGPG